MRSTVPGKSKTYSTSARVLVEVGKIRNTGSHHVVRELRRAHLSTSLKHMRFCWFHELGPSAPTDFSSLVLVMADPPINRQPLKHSTKAEPRTCSSARFALTISSTLRPEKS